MRTEMKKKLKVGGGASDARAVNRIGPADEQADGAPPLPPGAVVATQHQVLAIENQRLRGQIAGLIKTIQHLKRERAEMAKENADLSDRLLPGDAQDHIDMGDAVVAAAGLVPGDKYSTDVEGYKGRTVIVRAQASATQAAAPVPPDKKVEPSEDVEQEV